MSEQPIVDWGPNFLVGATINGVESKDGHAILRTDAGYVTINHDLVMVCDRWASRQAAFKEKQERQTLLDLLSKYGLPVTEES